MAAAYDAGSSAQEDGTSSPLSWTHTPVGTPSIAIVTMYIRSFDTVSVTYGGAAMTEVPNTYQTGSYIFYKVSPASGAQTVSVSYTPSGPHLVAGCMTFTGTGTNTPADGTNAADGDGDNTLTVSNTTVFDIVVENAGNVNDCTCAPQSGQTEVWDLEAGTSGYHGAGYYVQGSAGSTNVRVTLSGSNTVHHSACRIPGPIAYTQAVDGTITFTQESKHEWNDTGKQTAGTVTFSGIWQNLSPYVYGVLDFSGALNNDIGNVVNGVLNLAGTVTKGLATTLGGTLMLSGEVVKGWARTFAGVLNFSGHASGTNFEEVIARIYGKPSPIRYIRSAKRQ